MQRISKKYLIISALILIAIIVIAIWAAVVSSANRRRSEYNIEFFNYSSLNNGNIHLPAQLSDMLSELQSSNMPVHKVVPIGNTNRSYCVIITGSERSGHILINSIKYSDNKVFIDYSVKKYGFDDSQSGTDMNIALIRLNVPAENVEVKQSANVEYIQSNKIISDQIPVEISDKVLPILTSNKQKTQKIETSDSIYVLLYMGKVTGSNAYIDFDVESKGKRLEIKYSFIKNDGGEGVLYPHVLIKLPKDRQVSIKD